MHNDTSVYMILVILCFFWLPCLSTSSYSMYTSPDKKSCQYPYLQKNLVRNCEIWRGLSFFCHRPLFLPVNAHIELLILLLILLCTRLFVYPSTHLPLLCCFDDPETIWKLLLASPHTLVTLAVGWQMWDSQTNFLFSTSCWGQGHRSPWSDLSQDQGVIRLRWLWDSVLLWNLAMLQLVAILHQQRLVSNLLILTHFPSLGCFVVIVA